MINIVDGVAYRYVHLDGEIITEEQKQAIQRGVEKTLKKFKKINKDDILINLVACQNFGDPVNPEDVGMGMYLNSLQIVNIATLKPDGMSKAVHLEELEITAIHELIHYYHDVHDILPPPGEDQEYEDDVEKWTLEIFDS